MSDDLVQGQGTYHRTDMLPDSGEEANSLWARYLAENAEYSFHHGMQMLFSFVTNDPFISADSVFDFYAGAVGTVHGYLAVVAGTWVMSFPGASNGGTFTTGQKRQTVLLGPGTVYESGWGIGTLDESAAGSISSARIWGQP